MFVAVGAVILASTATGALALEVEGARYVYGGVPDAYDIEASIAQEGTDASGASAVRMAGH